MARSSLKLLAATLLAATSIAANAAQVSFSFTNSGTPWGSGSFVGTDSNSDNLLTQSELSSFAAELPPEGIFGLSLGDLSGFGSFNLLTGVWNADGQGWGNPNFAWFSWNGTGNSVNPTWATMSIDRFVPDSNAVPEPATLALAGLGLIGVFAGRKRKSA